MSAQKLFSERFRQTAALFRAASEDASLIESLGRAAEASSACLGRGGRVFICGNGGSASQATHLSGELIGPFMDRARRALSAIPLGFDPASLTACANDFGFDAAYARQLDGLGRAGDILWALSTSGRSRNIVAAMRRAREMSITTVLLTNHDGGPCRVLADHLLTTPVADTPRVQELHLLYGHCLCEWIEHALTVDNG